MLKQRGWDDAQPGAPGVGLTGAMAGMKGARGASSSRYDTLSCHSSDNDQHRRFAPERTSPTRARARARTHTHTHTHALFTGAAKGASGTKEAARETAEEIAAKLIRGFKVRLVKSSESERQKHRQRQR